MKKNVHKACQVASQPRYKMSFLLAQNFNPIKTYNLPYKLNKTKRPFTYNVTKQRKAPKIMPPESS